MPSAILSRYGGEPKKRVTTSRVIRSAGSVIDERNGPGASLGLPSNSEEIKAPTLSAAAGQEHEVASRSRLPRYRSNVDRMAQRSEAGFKKPLALCRVRMNCSGDVFEPRTHLER